MRLALVLLLLAPRLASGACPETSGPLPATYSYDMTDGRRVARASVLLPFPAGSVAPAAAAVKAEPSWMNLQAQGSIPEAVPLRPMLESGKLEEPVLDVTAEADAQCPGATRVTATFSWSFGAVARLLGGDAKDLPALFALAVRDEIIARVLTTPEQARLRAGLEPADGVSLLRVAPFALEIADADFAPLKTRLDALSASKKVELGDALPVFLDLHRKASALAGFGALTATAGTPTTVNRGCPSCEIGYSLTATRSPDGKSGSLAFGLHGAR